MQANGGVAAQANKLQKELRSKEQENKALSRELKRKEAALAEAAALLVLRKKAQAFWGTKRTNDQCLKSRECHHTDTRGSFCRRKRRSCVQRTWLDTANVATMASRSTRVYCQVRLYLLWPTKGHTSPPNPAFIG